MYKAIILLFVTFCLIVVEASSLKKLKKIDNYKSVEIGIQTEQKEFIGLNLKKKFDEDRKKIVYLLEAKYKASNKPVNFSASLDKEDFVIQVSKENELGLKEKDSAIPILKLIISDDIHTFEPIQDPEEQLIASIDLEGKKTISLNYELEEAIIRKLIQHNGSKIYLVFQDKSVMQAKLRNNAVSKINKLLSSTY